MIARRIFSFLRGRISHSSRGDGVRRKRFLTEAELYASLNQPVLESARKLVTLGADVELILLFLRDRGFDQIDSILAVMALMGIPHDEAKKLVTFSKAWSDRFESVKDLHEKAHKAMLELIASGEIELVGDDEEEPLQ